MARVPVYPASRPGKWKLQTIQIPAVLARFWELLSAAVRGRARCGVGWHQGRRDASVVIQVKRDMNCARKPCPHCCMKNVSKATCVAREAVQCSAILVELTLAGFQ